MADHPDALVVHSAGLGLGLAFGRTEADSFRYPTPVMRKNAIYAAVEGTMGEPQVFVGRIVMD